MPVTNVSLMGKNPQLPYDLQAEIARQEVARKMAEAILGQPGKSSGVIQAGRVGVADLTPLGELFAKTRANKDMTEAQDKQTKLAQIYNTMQAQEMGNLNDILYGGEQQIPRTAEHEQWGPDPMVKREIDPVGAVKMGTASAYPEVRKRAQEIEKGFATPQDLIRQADKFTPESMEAIQGSQRLSKARHMPIIKESGGVISTTDPRSGMVTNRQPVQTFGPPQIEPMSGLATQKGSVTEKHDPISTNYPPETALSQLYAKKDLDQLTKGYEGYTKGIETLGFINQAKSDVAATEADQFGSFAQTIMKANRLIERLGGKPLPENARTEVIHSTMGNLMIDRIKALYPVSNTDINMMQTIVGTEGNTKRALQKILEIAEASIVRQMGIHEKFVENMTLPAGADRERIRQQWAPKFEATIVKPYQSPEERGGDPDFMQMSPKDVIEWIKTH